MAVALGGIFGNIYGQYSQLANARFWNTKSYDYPLVANKGELNQNATNEFSGTLNKTSLFVATNKTGYVNTMNGYVSDKNQIYQIRNVDGSVNNNYYVDQETGDVYLRPATLNRNGSTQSQGPTNITNPIASPQYNVTLTPGADTITGTQTYNWGTINTGNRVNIWGEYTLDNINWFTIPGTTRTLDSVTGGTGSINFSIPTETLKVRWRGELEQDPPGTTTYTYGYKYDYTNSSLVSGINNSTQSGNFDLSGPPGSTVTAQISLKHNWLIPAGSPNNAQITNGYIQYSTNNGLTWNTVTGSTFNYLSPPNLPGQFLGPDTVVSVPPALLVNGIRFRVVSDLSPASPGEEEEIIIDDPLTVDHPVYPPPPPGPPSQPYPVLSPNPRTFYSNYYSYDLSNAKNPHADPNSTKLDFQASWNFTEGGQVVATLQRLTGVDPNNDAHWTDVPGGVAPSLTLDTSTSSGNITLDLPDLVTLGQIGNSNARFRVKYVITQGTAIPYPDQELHVFSDTSGSKAIIQSPSLQLSTTPYPPTSIEWGGTFDYKANKVINARLEINTGSGWTAVPGTTLNYSNTVDTTVTLSNTWTPGHPSPFPDYPAYFQLRWAHYTDNTFTTLETASEPGPVNLTINGAGDTLTGVPFGYDTATAKASITNSTALTINGRYQHHNGFTWVDISGSDFTLPPAAPGFPVTIDTSASVSGVANGHEIRVVLDSPYAGTGVTLSNQSIDYGIDHYDNFNVALVQHFNQPKPAELPSLVSDNFDFKKTYDGQAELPTFNNPLSNGPDNFVITKNITINPGAAPVYQNGNFTLNATYDSYNSIALPSGVISNQNEPQYFGTNIFLDEVPKPEEFGQGAVNNIKVKSAHPALFTTFPTGTTSSDYSKADYMELIVNNVTISVGNLDTSKIPAVVPLTDPQSAFYRFSNNFTGGDQDFSIVKGNWSIDTSTGQPTSGQYVTDNRTFSERYNETVFNRMPMDNFIVSTDIYVDDVTTGVNPNPVGNATNFAGIRIRATNPGDPVEQSGYLIAYENSQIKVLKGDDPVASFSTGVPTFGNGSKRNLKVHANGNDIQIYVDDTFVGQYIDPYYSYTSGYTSFVTTGRKVGYDNVLISSYASPIQLLSQALKKGENSIVVKTFGNKNSIIDVSGTIGGVNLSTSNIPPNLNTDDINHERYKHSSIPGLQGYELDRTKAYWSASTQSALGIAGKITFKNKEGGAIHKTKQDFSRVNSMMTNLTSLLGLVDDTFNSHLNIIR